tara:strand:+ start:19550 stop:20536 length:987 start_codon:yes stop_codon:yes gene_type:complete
MSKDKENTKRTFEIEGKTYAVVRPSVETLKRGTEIRSKTFNEALQGGDMLRDQLEGELRKRGLWNDDREEEYQGLRQDVVDGEFQLSKGGIRLSEARDVALGMSESRERMVDMLSSRSELDQNTCEGRADAARFNLLFAESLVYEDTGEKYFPNGLDDYLTQLDNSITTKGAAEFYYLISGTENLDDSLPETQFLKQYKLVDDKKRLIDKDGRLITKEGKHIDEFGNFIKWTGEEEYVFVDLTGREVEKVTGDFKVEFSPFLEEDGEPIVLEEEIVAEEEATGDRSQEEPSEPEAKKAPVKKKTTRRKSPAKAKVEKKEEAPTEEEAS